MLMWKTMVAGWNRHACLRVFFRNRFIFIADRLPTTLGLGTAGTWRIDIFASFPWAAICSQNSTSSILDGNFKTYVIISVRTGIWGMGPGKNGLFPSNLV